MDSAMPHEEPQTDYERMLDRMGLDCARHACWNPMVVVVLCDDGLKRGFCREHIEPGEIQQWLES